MPEQRDVYVHDMDGCPFKLMKSFTQSFTVMDEEAKADARTALAALTAKPPQPRSLGEWPAFRGAVLKAKMDMLNAGGAFSEEALILPIKNNFQDTPEFSKEVHDLKKKKAPFNEYIALLNQTFTSRGGPASRPGPRATFAGRRREGRHRPARERFDKTPGAPCRMFAAGKCRFGDECKFSHAQPAEEGTAAPGPRRRGRRDPTPPPSSFHAGEKLNKPPDATYAFHATAADAAEKFDPNMAATSAGARLGLGAILLSCPTELAKLLRLVLALALAVGIFVMLSSDLLPALPFGPIAADASPTTAQHAFHAMPNNSQHGDWIFDSGTTKTTTNDPADMRTSTAAPAGLGIHTGGGPVGVRLSARWPSAAPTSPPTGYSPRTCQ